MASSRVGKLYAAFSCAMVVLLRLNSAEGLVHAKYHKHVEAVQEETRAVLPPDQAALLDKHNSLRAGVGVPALTWNKNAAKAAADWAKGCIWKHPENSYGQNFFQTMSSVDFTIQPSQLAAGVQNWYDEKQWYSYSTNKCNAPPGYSCGHYTQVVWKKTTSVGCGYARCENSPMNANKWKTLYFLVCYYTPKGNVGVEKPYLRSYKKTEHVRTHDKPTEIQEQLVL